MNLKSFDLPGLKNARRVPTTQGPLREPDAYFQLRDLAASDHMAKPFPDVCTLIRLPEPREVEP